MKTHIPIKSLTTKKSAKIAIPLPVAILLFVALFAGYHFMPASMREKLDGFVAKPLPETPGDRVIPDSALASIPAQRHSALWGTQKYYDEALQTMLEESPTGVNNIFTNAENGHKGDLKVYKTVENANGAICREFLYEESWPDSSIHTKRYGRACRQPDGSWQLPR